MTKLGTIAKMQTPSATVISSGLRIISLRMRSRQYGHRISTGLATINLTSTRMLWPGVLLVAHAIVLAPLRTGWLPRRHPCVPSFCFDQLSDGTTIESYRPRQENT